MCVLKGVYGAKSPTNRSWRPSKCHACDVHLDCAGLTLYRMLQSWTKHSSKIRNRRRFTIFGHVGRLCVSAPAHGALRLTVDPRAGQQTRMIETSAGSSLRGKPGSVLQLELEVDDWLSADIVWSTASDREAWRTLYDPLPVKRFSEWVSEWVKGVRVMYVTTGPQKEKGFTRSGNYRSQDSSKWLVRNSNDWQLTKTQSFRKKGAVTNYWNFFL